MDARGKVPLSRGVYWSDDRIFGARANFRLSEPSGLSVVNVRESDEGLYRCRVDFKTSPTRNTLIKLTVIGEIILQFQWNI